MEALFVIIVIGALLLLAVRISAHRREKIDTEEIRRSTEIMKKELERSGSAIITRMGTHVNKLERLIREAQNENNRLLSQTDAAAKLRDSLAQLIAEARVVEQKLAEQQRAAATAPIYQPPPATNRVAPLQPTTASFAQVLQNTLNNSNAYDEEPISPPKAVNPPPSFDATSEVNEDHYEDEYETDEEFYDEDDEEEISEDNRETSTNETDMLAARNLAKEMLTKGHTVDETARETGLGRGAVELMRKMIKR